MSQHPMPVVIISSHSKKGSINSLKALEYGAVEVVNKPMLHNKDAVEEAKIKLCDIIKAASIAKLKPRYSQPVNKVEPKLSVDAIIPKTTTPKVIYKTETIIAIGASTGGTEAIRAVLEAMPLNAPGIVIVQHMPEHFTRSFAERLNDLCKIQVKEAMNNDEVGCVIDLIAPGNKHMMLKRTSTRYYVEINTGPLINRHRPSVDVLFRSTAKYAGKNAIGIIMTGMGDDGARGLLEMKEAGAKTAAQDERSCIVFGMPKVAISMGAVDKVLPLDKLADFALNK